MVSLKEETLSLRYEVTQVKLKMMWKDCELWSSAGGGGEPAAGESDSDRNNNARRGTMWPTDKELKKQSDSTHRNTREREMVTDTERKPETSVQEKSEKRYVERGREVNNGKVSRNVTDRFQRYFKWLVALVWGWIPQTLNFGDLLTLTEYLQSVNMQNIIWHSWSPEDDSLMAPLAGW